MTFEKRDPFFVQAHERGVWHVESLADPETMLCGLFVSVESSAKIQKRWGLKRCLWCENALRLALSSPGSRG